MTFKAEIVKRSAVLAALRETRDSIEQACDCPPQEHLDDGCEGVIDVRLQVQSDGSWSIRTGSSDFDQDHTGNWGCGSVACDDTESTLNNVAGDLIEQAIDMAAGCGDLEEEVNEDVEDRPYDEDEETLDEDD